MERITIIGLGLVGGSISLALKQSQLKDVEFVGSDLSRDAESAARKLGVVDRTETDPARAVKGAALVVIAAPVRAIRDVLERIAPAVEEGAVITDTGSTKTEVLRWAKELLPTGVNFVGGHPMAGKETAGVAAADAALFREKIYCITPTVDANERAVQAVVGLVQRVGATPWFIDAEEHDRYVAAVSHVPIVMSAALFSMARGSKAWNDLAPLASSGFKDVTRLASGDARMSADIFATNRDSVLHWLDRYIDELVAYRRLVAAEDGDEALHQRLSSVQDGRDEFMAGRGYDRGMPRPPVELPSASSSLSSMLVPGWASDRLRDIDKSQGDRAKDVADKVRRDLEGGDSRDRP